MSYGGNQCPIHVACKESRISKPCTSQQSASFQISQEMMIAYCVAHETFNFCMGRYEYWCGWICVQKMHIWIILDGKMDFSFAHIHTYVCTNVCTYFNNCKWMHEFGGEILIPPPV